MVLFHILSAIISAVHARKRSWEVIVIRDFGFTKFHTQISTGLSLTLIGKSVIINVCSVLDQFIAWLFVTIQRPGCWGGDCASRCFTHSAVWSRLLTNDSLNSRNGKHRELSMKRLSKRASKQKAIHEDVTLRKFDWALDKLHRSVCVLFLKNFLNKWGDTHFKESRLPKP